MTFIVLGQWDVRHFYGMSRTLLAVWESWLSTRISYDCRMRLVVIFASPCLSVKNEASDPGIRGDNSESVKGHHSLVDGVHTVV